MLAFRQAEFVVVAITAMPEFFYIFARVGNQTALSVSVRANTQLTDLIRSHYGFVDA